MSPKGGAQTGEIFDVMDPAETPAVETPGGGGHFEPPPGVTGPFLDLGQGLKDRVTALQARWVAQRQLDLLEEAAFCQDRQEAAQLDRIDWLAHSIYVCMGLSKAETFESAYCQLQYERLMATWGRASSATSSSGGNSFVSSSGR